MNSKRNSFGLVRLSVAAVLTLVAALYLLSRGTTQMRAQQSDQGHTPIHMTTDWSNRHMVYSAPSTLAEAWRLQAEPRYLHQWTRRNLVAGQKQNAR